MPIAGNREKGNTGFDYFAKSIFNKKAGDKFVNIINNINSIAIINKGKIGKNIKIVNILGTKNFQEKAKLG